MGYESASRQQLAPGKQTLTDRADEEAVTTPGKRTLTEGLGAASAQGVTAVAARAGESVDDGGGYTFRVLPAGTFAIATTPAGREAARDQVITPTRFPEAWQKLARRLLARPPATRATTTAPAPAPAAAPAVEPDAAPSPDAQPQSRSEIDGALEGLEREVGEIRDGARDLWRRAMGVLSSSGHPGAPTPPSGSATPVAPIATATAPATAAKPVPPGVEKSVKPPQAPPRQATSKREKRTGSTEGMSAGDIAYRTLVPTEEGDTLDIAATRARLGDAGTTYTFGVGNTLIDGVADATKFYCSGLSLWTLSAAGYDVRQPIRGVDGTPFSFTLVAPNPDPKTKDKTPEIETQKFVTLKAVIDGEPATVEAMIRAEQATMVNGGWIGRVQDKGPGHSIGYDGAEPAQAVRGAAAAFELAHIGGEVAELDQKPGDFVQTRHKDSHYEPDPNDKDPKDKTGKPRKQKRVRIISDDQNGGGHAWQVWSVTVVGHAIFGREGSPVPADQARLDGWKTGVTYVIDKTTDPKLVGPHTIKKARRLEANLGNEEHPGNGGVWITNDRDVPAVDEAADQHVFVGRLGTSRWTDWKAASDPAAEPATAAPAAPAPKPADATSDS